MPYSSAYAIVSTSFSSCRCVTCTPFVGETEPTIDSIEVAEFESHAALKEWISKNAPAFTV